MLVYCAFFNETTQAWETGEVQVAGSVGYAVVCSTPHLTDFGVLLGRNAERNSGGNGGGEGNAGGGGNGDANGEAGYWTTVEILSLAFAAAAIVSVVVAISVAHTHFKRRSKRLRRKLHEMGNWYMEAMDAARSHEVMVT